MSTETVKFDVMSVLIPQDRARLMTPKDVIPVSLDAGFDLLGNLDREWIWILESDDKIKGVLVASPCHGTAFMWRLSVDPSVSKVGVLRLLRRFFGDLRRRGVKGYMTIIDPSTVTQGHLVKMLEKVGAVEIKKMTLFAGSLPKEGL